MRGKIRCILVALLAVAVPLAASTTSMAASKGKRGKSAVVRQVPKPPPPPPPEPTNRCWTEYSTCIEGTFGDDSWRSACYADMTTCVKQAPPESCDEAASTGCANFEKRCLTQAGAVRAYKKQCAEDLDTCRLALGC
jgi:hypothetical protein